MLLSETHAWALNGLVFELLAPLMDGSRDADELVGALAEKVDGATAYYALALLEKEGHTSESTPEICKEKAAFWHGLEIEPRAAIETLKSKRVRVRAVGEVDGDPLRGALTDLGLVPIEEEEVDLNVVVTDDYQRPELGALNAGSLETGRPWLLLKPLGHELWLGPLFVPGETGCHRCLVKQLVRNRPVHQFVAEKSRLWQLHPASRAASSATINAACQLAAVEIIKFIAGANHGLQGKLLSLDVRTLSTVSHHFVKQPTCPACGKHAPAKPVPLELVNRKATSMQDCGHRTELPAQTLNKYQHLVSPITGVVTALSRLRNAHGPVHVYAAGHNRALKIESLHFLKAGLRNVSSGKGISEAQAKASALCEAIERYSGERSGAELIVTASLRKMRERFSTDVIHPNEVMLYSERQLMQHAAWNAKKSKFNRVPKPLDESVPIDWTPLWSLTHARHKYLPTQLLYYQSMASAQCDTFYCMGCSNGNASGNNLEEAVLQGLCELVERDAVALWWYNRLRKPSVAVDSFNEPYLLDLIKYYRTLDREAWALDITNDLGIPAFAAVSRLCAGQEERILFGLGCHLDVRIALQRAFTEMNQMLSFASGDESGRLTIEDDETLFWLRTATIVNQPYMAPDNMIAPKRMEDYPLLHSGDLLKDIQLCQRIVEDRGMQVLVLDQTRPEVKMPVVKVVVPGLRHFWARFAPGRLYDIPVQMGWQKQPLTEDALNPIAVFF